MKYIYIVSILVFALHASCKKEVVKLIDYNSLTEERILGVSEQITIAEADIPPLERLVKDKVKDAGVQSRLLAMVNSVKQLVKVLPMMEQLRSDEDINFLDKYNEILPQVKLLTDQLPRKQKLLKELEDNKDGYSKEEVQFTTDFSQGMVYYLKEVYKIQPIPDRPSIVFRRTDIDRVDSVPDYSSLTYGDLKRFSNLRVINADFQRHDIPELNLNKFTNLRKLRLRLNKNIRLEMDSVKRLTELSISGFGQTERIDFTGICDSLRLFSLYNVGPALKSVILPGKKFLEDVRLEASDGPSPNLDTLIVEGSGKTMVIWNSITTTDIKLVSLSKIETIGLYGSSFVQTGTTNGWPDGYYVTSKIQKLEIDQSSVKNISLGKINLPWKPDFSMFPQLKTLYWMESVINAPDPKTMNVSFSDLESIMKVESLTALNIMNVTFQPNTVLDFRKQTKLIVLIMEPDYDDEGPPIKKLIISNIAKNGKDEYGNEFTLSIYPEPESVEYVD